MHPRCLLVRHLLLDWSVGFLRMSELMLFFLWLIALILLWIQEIPNVRIVDLEDNS